MPPSTPTSRRRQSRFSLTLSLFALAFVPAACDCGGSTAAVCESPGAPADCGSACTAGGSECGAGTYCGTDGVCTADCEPGVGDRCAASQTCNPDGQCVPASDGGAGGGGAGAGGGSGSGGDGGSAGGGGDVCSNLMVTPDPVRPYIVVIVDRSGSMTSDFPYGTEGDGGVVVDCNSADPPCSSRWDSLRDVLVGADTGPLAGTGVIEAFQSAAHFGVVQYTGDADGSDFMGEPWPDLIETPAALDNLAAIEADYLPESGSNPPGNGDTPTGESMWTTLCHLDPPYLAAAADAGPAPDGGVPALGCASYLANTQAPSESYPPNPVEPLLPGDRDPDAPVVFVLATDGAPDSSVDPDPGFNSGDGRAAREFVMMATRETRAAGIPTYVISVSDEDRLNDHLAHVACEGGTGPLPVDAPTGNPAEPLCENPSPNTAGPGAILAFDTVALRQALVDIVGATIPCSFELNGTLSDVAEARSSGTVTVGEMEVPLSETDGWWLLDDGVTFELRGQTCDDFRSNPGESLSAVFPCDSGIDLIPF